MGLILRTINALGILLDAGNPEITKDRSTLLPVDIDAIVSSARGKRK
jgi:hypothetical protein